MTKLADRQLRNLLLLCRDAADMNRTPAVLMDAFGTAYREACEAGLIYNRQNPASQFGIMAISAEGREKLAEFAPRPEALAFAKKLLPNHSETRVASVAAQLDDLIADANITPELFAAIRLVRNMAYQFHDDGGIVFDLVDDDADQAANEAALEKESDAIDVVDRFLIDLQIGNKIGESASKGEG